MLESVWDDMSFGSSFSWIWVCEAEIWKDGGNREVVVAAIGGSSLISASSKDAIGKNCYDQLFLT